MVFRSSFYLAEQCAYLGEDEVQSNPVKYFTFSIIKPQVDVPSSDRVNEDQFHGVCKVTVAAGQLTGQGSGFLFKFQSDEHREIFGLLTCYHVIHFDRQQAIPVPAQVTLEFQSRAQAQASSLVRRTLAQAQNPNAQPILSPEHDIYFLELSAQFRQDIATSGIPVYESMDPVFDRQVWIAQFPGGTQRHVANAIFDASLNPTGGVFPHRVSTRPGGSGSPLLQQVQQGNNLRAIGMHHGGYGNIPMHGPLNYATSIVTIKDILNHRILHGTDPPLPAHAASAAIESTMGTTIAYSSIRIIR